MKFKMIFTAMLIVLSSSMNYTKANEYKVGNVFYIDLPDYLQKTMGINDDASFQFKNVVKDIYGFVIEDDKENLELLDVKFNNVMEFYEFSIKDLAIENMEPTLGTPVQKTVNNKKYVLNDIVFSEKNSSTGIYYFAAVVETDNTYYQVRCFCDIKDKDKYKADFEKILYSLND